MKTLRTKSFKHKFLFAYIFFYDFQCFKAGKYLIRICKALCQSVRYDVLNCRALGTCKHLFSLVLETSFVHIMIFITESTDSSYFRRTFFAHAKIEPFSFNRELTTFEAFDF